MCKKTLRTQISSEKGPQSVGPYSLGIGVQADAMIYLSGQLPNDVNESIKKQTIQVIENIETLLEEAGSSLSSVVKTTIFLTDMNDFDAMNQMYAVYFSHPYPARSCVAVSALPKGAKIQIECIAIAQDLREEAFEECNNCDE